MDGVWRSLVAHLFWVQGVVGSNPASPTIRCFPARYPYVSAEAAHWHARAIHSRKIWGA